MKNQPNKAPVKDGSSIAERILNDHLWMGTEPTEAQSAILAAMQEYSDQQNAELRERVKELEGSLTATLNVARAYDRSRFVDILDKAEKTLKK